MSTNVRAILTGVRSVLCYRRRTPRYLHIWPWTTLEQRLQVRTQAVADGDWPPENSGPQLRDMRSTIYLPTAFSPLQ
jgi:hypothetical protein